jgi:4-amino-4-deoxy-L-arabinose transferase-like glycosyltransferase
LFWTQSFERLAGDRKFVSSPEFSFFYHTLLWAILPWSLLVYSSVFGRIKYLWDIRFRPSRNVEFLTLGGSLILFHIMSASKFKLPHYLNILFPLFAILLASYLGNLEKFGKQKVLDAFRKIQLFVVAIIVLGAVLVNSWFFPMRNIWFLIGAVLLLGCLVYVLFQKQSLLYRIIVPSAVAILALAYLLNTNFYPQLMTYQSGNSIARIAKEQGIPSGQIVAYKQFTYSLDFYLHQSTPVLNLEQVKSRNDSKQHFYLVVYGKDIEEIRNAGLNTSRIYTTPHFHVSRLDIEFLNPGSRPKSVETAYLMQIN